MAMIAVKAALLLASATAAAAQGQDPWRIDSIRRLPRPGYEIGRWQIGSTALLPSLSVGVSHDSNVFATSAATVGDTAFDVRPRIDIERRGSDLEISADVYADGRFLAEQTTENGVAFGIGAAGRYTADSRSRLSASLRFDRNFQRRSDPEANPQLLEPARFNTLSAEVGYGFTGNRFGFNVSGSVQQVDFLAIEEDDRDLLTWRAPIRLSFVPSAGVGIYVEPYVNYRDARLPVDRFGFDRDALTYGILAGVSFDVTARLRGELGAGGFRSDPGDPRLDSFSGLALNGRLTWSPDERALVTFSAFNGDVATIQAGANGRIDTRLQLRWDQEVRHNLLFNMGLGYRRTSYRGNLQRRLRVLSVDAEIEYLLSRTLSVFLNAAHESRDANDARDRFERTTAGIGIRVRI